MKPPFQMPGWLRGQASRLVFLGALASLLVVPSSLAQQRPRLLIKVTNYASASDSSQDLLVNILTNKISNLIQEMIPNAGDDSLSYLTSLKIEETGTTQPLSLEERLDYWRRSQALEVLGGIVMTSAEGGDIVASSVDLGELGGELPKRTVDLELELTMEEFRSTRDAHSLVTLYALCMDARRLDKDPNAISTILAKAHFIAQGLDIAHLQDVERVKERVRVMLAEIEKETVQGP